MARCPCDRRWSGLTRDDGIRLSTKDELFAWNSASASELLPQILPRKCLTSRLACGRCGKEEQPFECPAVTNSEELSHYDRERKRAAEFQTHVLTTSLGYAPGATFWDQVILQKERLFEPASLAIPLHDPELERLRSRVDDVLGNWVAQSVEYGAMIERLTELQSAAESHRDSGDASGPHQAEAVRFCDSMVRLQSSLARPTSPLEVFYLCDRIRELTPVDEPTRDLSAEATPWLIQSRIAIGDLCAQFLGGYPPGMRFWSFAVPGAKPERFCNSLFDERFLTEEARRQGESIDCLLIDWVSGQANLTAASERLDELVAGVDLEAASTRNVETRQELVDLGSMLGGLRETLQDFGAHAAVKRRLGTIRKLLIGVPFKGTEGPLGLG